MEWAQVCADKSLQDLPYKIELNERGQIEMTPTSVRHSLFQGKICRLLATLKRPGTAMPECAVKTGDNVKVPDVVWVSAKRLAKIRDDAACAVAPEICVEVMSPENSLEEMMFKRSLYLEAGAREFWLCDLNGRMRFFSSQGEVKQSKLVPNFPRQVKI